MGNGIILLSIIIDQHFPIGAEVMGKRLGRKVGLRPAFLEQGEFLFFGVNIGWDETEELIGQLAESIKARCL